MRIVPALLILVCAGSASAADFPRRPVAIGTPILQPAERWTGFYIGGNIGGGWANAKSDFSTTGPVFGTADNHMAGWAGGLQLGYNWQRGPLVFGAETDFQFANLDGSLRPLVPLRCAELHFRRGMTRRCRGSAPCAAGWATRKMAGCLRHRRLRLCAAEYRCFSDCRRRHCHFEPTGFPQWLGSRRWHRGRADAAVEFKAEYLYTHFGSHTTTWAVPGLPNADRLHQTQYEYGPYRRELSVLIVQRSFHQETFQFFLLRMVARRPGAVIGGAGMTDRYFWHAGQ